LGRRGRLHVHARCPSGLPWHGVIGDKSALIGGGQVRVLFR
jgi:hypothetical protein